MQLPRFTVRRLMIIVVVFAMAASVYFLRQESTDFANLLHEHESNLKIYQYNRDAIYIRRFSGEPDFNQKLSVAQEARREAWDRWVQYEERLVMKYRRAVLSPDVTVEPDPAPPYPLRP